jgi:HD-GYP domain-containing protein (c-di-GMP phosphodiesterase class II)
VLGALSLASDLSVGLPAEHGLRSCYIAMRLAERMGLSATEKANVYYTTLLMDAGCTAWTSQIARRMLTEEIVARRELVFNTDIRRPLQVANWLRRFVGNGASLPVRAQRIADFAAHGREIVREGFHNTCDVASNLAARLGMSAEVQRSLVSVFEQWDGAGFPGGLKDEEIPLTARIVYLSAFFEVFHSSGGRLEGVRLVRQGSAKAFDPRAASALLSLASEADFWEPLETDEGLWGLISAMEPAGRQQWVSREQLQDAATALADFADMKSPFYLGHSRRVAVLAKEVSERVGVRGESAANLVCAALTHDLGVVAVPSFILDKPVNKLSSAEWEQLRLHPYHGERILAKVPALREAAVLVGAHHERPDGKGYYRGLKESEIPMGAHVIAVCDEYDELTHDGPERPAIEPADALRLLEGEFGHGASSAALDALRDYLGFARTSPRVRPEWPAGLTDREVEVLRLIARGLNRREAATALVVSESTVRSHLEHIYAKIGVSSRAGATLYAVEHDLLN